MVELAYDGAEMCHNMPARRNGCNALKKVTRHCNKLRFFNN